MGKVTGMRKILSFIIPSYNCEQYLDKCITSFLNEKVLDRLDIIIVNDGSTDNTEKIAKKYAQQYHNPFDISHKLIKGMAGL